MDQPTVRPWTAGSASNKFPRSKEAATNALRWLGPAAARRLPTKDFYISPLLSFYIFLRGRARLESIRIYIELLSFIQCS